MYYFITMIFLLLFYIVSIGIISNVNKSKKIINVIFSITVFLFYLFCAVAIYRDVGLKDWNFLNCLPVANVSPFMYTLVFLSLFFPKNIKKYILILVSLLSFSMICASIIACISYIIRHYAFHLTIFVDIFIHMLLSLYGVYLVKSKQVDLRKTKDVVIAGGLIIAVALLMLVINLIFKTSFFGLSMYGAHSIYNVVLVESGVVNAILYFCGLSMLLITGYFYQKLLNKK